MRAVVAGSLTYEKARRRINVLLTDNRRIRAINKRFLKHDRPTDVIAFGLDGGQGDIVVSVQTARQMSRRLEVPFREELARYLVHGTLHLLGYDDRSRRSRDRMWRRQEKILRTVL